MKFQVTHTTRYHYSQPVTLCHNEVHLQPRSEAGQECEASWLFVDPLPARVHERTDYFGNRVTYFVVQEPHETLTVKATSVVRREPVAMPDPARSRPWDRLAAWLRSADVDACEAARDVTLESPLVPLGNDLREYASPSFSPGRPLLEAVAELAHRIHADFVYAPQFTTVATPLSEVLAHRRGVCQDFAHLGIGCLRAMGLPARYVSGYIESVAPPGGERLQGADASHAWFSAFDPEFGWVDFDPTNDQFVAERHVILAWGRDYSDVSPVKGVILGGGSHRLQVEVDMLSIGDGVAGGE